MPATETYRSTVEPKDCDALGHMNVSRYFVACSDAVANFQTLLGLTTKDLREGRKLSFAVVHIQADFHAELEVGESIYMTTEIKAIGTKSMTFHHRLFQTDGDKLCFESTAKLALLSFETRKAVVIPDDVRLKAQAYLAG